MTSGRREHSHGRRDNSRSAEMEFLPSKTVKGKSRSGPTTQHGRGCAAAATTTPTPPWMVDQDMGTCSCCIGRMQETERAVPCSRFAGWIRRCLHLHHSCLSEDGLLTKIQTLLGHTNQTQQLKCTQFEIQLTGSWSTTVNSAPTGPLDGPRKDYTIQIMPIRGASPDCATPKSP